ncbi:MAG: hypothetical protein ACR5LF_05170 [Symbiopectobacterium sp.]
MLYQLIEYTTGEDDAINNRGKAFIYIYSFWISGFLISDSFWISGFLISGFLTYQSPIDVRHYALAPNIGHSSKSNEIDPIMIN